MDNDVDVVVLGTGVAGLVAALAAHDSGARVALIEKGPTVGGTTALSAGVAWLPANPKQADVGVTDTVETGVEYLMSLSHGLIDEQLARTFCETTSDLVGWLEAKTPLRLRVVEGYPDYHPENPGGQAHGTRSLEPELFSFERLGDWADRVTPSEWDIGRMLAAEMPLGGGTGVLDPAVADERVRHNIHALGQALVGALLRGCLDRGIEPRTSTRALKLLVEGGRVRGVQVETDGETDELSATRGVILATGGFEFDPGFVSAFLRGPMTAPAGVSENTGDGLRMAMRLGAQLGTMREAWWIPCVEITGEQHYGHQRVCLILRERTVPGTLMVNRQARRFTNEAADYNSLGAAFHAFDPTTFEYQNLPCWLILDHQCFQRYGFPIAGVMPGDTAPDWMTVRDSIAELARAIGIPPAEMETTVARFNDNAQTGCDPDFGRGDSAYDGFNGDQTLPGVQATLGPLTAAPFYAVQVHSGTLGTKGGPRTDVDARVLDVDGKIIDGLYAAGNVGAAWTGMVYGGAGGTIGPAMVTGYRAGCHAARPPERG
ncbi:MAG TPA: FAD-dependent oxidoreductase [Pseudonocardia sp.]|nr:FAD-dependent oxidoreductase [Pseudonocardia sp.]